MRSMAQSAHLRLVAQPVEDEVEIGGTSQIALRFYDVISGDGTRLRAWTNQDPTFKGRDKRPIVVLCNGLGTNPYAWPALLDPACEVRVISWNHRGTGGSERPRDRSHVGIEAFVEDAVAVMDHARLKSAPVMGWSMGVNTCFELAVRHPDRVTGIFAVAGVPGSTFASMLAPFHLPRFMRAGLTVGTAAVLAKTGMPISKITTRMTIGPLLGLAISHSGFMLPTADLAMTRRCVTELIHIPVEWYMHLAVATSRHARVPLHGIKVPTAFVAGRWDLLAGPEDMKSAARKIPGATYTELRGSHFINLEQPARVHELMLRWLDRIN